MTSVRATYTGRGVSYPTLVDIAGYCWGKDALGTDCVLAVFVMEGDIHAQPIRYFTNAAIRNSENLGGECGYTE